MIVSTPTQTPPTVTLNNNQATCMVERPLLSGREFVNVCTGQKTLLPYTGVEIVGGILFAAFFLFIFAFVLGVFGVALLGIGRGGRPSTKNHTVRVPRRR